MLEFVHPDQWLRLQQLIAEANANPAVYLSLGNQYRTILDDIPTTNEYQDARNRFYAQALAAYSAGIEQLTNGAASSELGSLYSALAALYRTQVALADGRTDADYAAVMVDAAQQALSYLPVDDSHRRIGSVGC
ncbi:MAG: hypothetical protein R2932_32635 [Caldilineaceae bacterium]